MKFKFALAAFIVMPLALTACSKQDNAPASEQVAVSSATASETVTAEQQAAIEALDQPVLDEKNTDVPAEKSNAPADVATAEEASKVQ